jgi:hypothetical protein
MWSVERAYVSGSRSHNDEESPETVRLLRAGALYSVVYGDVIYPSAVAQQRSAIYYAL